MNGIGGTTDCIAYIDKIASMASSNPPNTLFISATAGAYGNINWYFDDSVAGTTYSFPPPTGIGNHAKQGVLAANPTASVIYSYNSVITNGTNVAGYCSPGIHDGYLTNGYPTNGQIVFSGASAWFLIETDESFNGQRVNCCGQGIFYQWFANNAFGGSNYANTAIGAVSQVDEPGFAVNNSYIYFGLWASGKIFASCAWNSFYGYGTPHPR